MILCPQQTGVLNFWMIIRETIDSVMLEGQITQIDITWRQNLGEVSKSANESI